MCCLLSITYPHISKEIGHAKVVVGVCCLRDLSPKMWWPNMNIAKTNLLTVAASQHKEVVDETGTPTGASHEHRAKNGRCDVGHGVWYI